MADPIGEPRVGLSGVTAPLVASNAVESHAQSRQARAQLEVLEEEVAAVTETAKVQASSAAALFESPEVIHPMAVEMLEVRKAGRPLDLEVRLQDGASTGVPNAGIWSGGETGIHTLRTGVLAERDRTEAAAPTNRHEQIPRQRSERALRKLTI